MPIRPVLLLLLLALVWASPAGAHESRPVYVEIEERSAHVYAVRSTIPPSITPDNRPRVILPTSCAALGAGETVLRCPSGLSGDTIGFDFPRFRPSVSILIRLNRLSGERHTGLLKPDENTWLVPARESAASVSAEYLGLGIEHILTGYDHLLFVACLILIARTWRGILLTVTGFTLGHSITLAIAAFGIVRLPTAPVEVFIALSVLFLATEIARGRRDTLSYRFPVVISAGFGLLHGLGFAAVLSEVGLPQVEVPLALLFFNLGVEIGQILFVLSVIALWQAVHRLPHWSPARVEHPLAYLVGCTAAFWFIDRIAAL
jgi:hydrogenase/urease accessory protein HupE